ncbi:MAG: AMP-binding protein [Kangiellaceae bacterium]|jgi:long-chain acyl-CoA synthetase|nr:AMP-binding protein [Kangiellaceae bacterium]
MTQQLIAPIQRFQQWVEQTPDNVYLRQPKDGQWDDLTFKEVWDRSARIAQYLTKLPQRSHVALYSLNCADWFIADLAIFMAGHISVPIYPTAGSHTISFILNHSDIKIAFVGKLFDWDDKKSCFDGKECISLFDDKENITQVKSIIANNDPIAEVYNPDINDIATLVYTSGTTGNPKGVMLSYRAIANSLITVDSVFSINQDDRFISYLPLAHVAERMIVEMASVYNGGTVSFVQSLDHFADNLQSVQPSIFFAVPRIWLKLKEGVEAKLGGAKMFKFLIKLPWLGNKLKATLKQKLGLAENRLAVSAAASLPQSILDWFEYLDVEICEAYGLSETSGFSHINLPGERKSGSVGKPFPGAKCMLAENGEVLLSNDSLMDGYYLEPDLTDAAIQDGWFRTGDLGREDEDGYLYITGRVKEIFKTAKGKYISPVPIESKLTAYITAEHMCLMGDGFTQPILIVSYLNDMTSAEKKQLSATIENGINEVNAVLEKHERIIKVLVVNEDWTTENNLMTPTLKIRRQQIEDRYHQYVSEVVENNKLVNFQDMS